MVYNAILIFKKNVTYVFEDINIVGWVRLLFLLKFE